MGSISLGMMMGGAASGFTAGFEMAQKAKEREEKRKAEKDKKLFEEQKYQTEQDQYKAEAFGSASKEIKTMQDKYLEQKEKIMGSDSKLSNKDKIKAMNALDKSYQEASSNTIKTLQAKKAWSPEIENQRLALETGEYGYYDNNGVEMYGSKRLTDAIATEGDNAWVEKDGTVKRWNYTGEEKKEEVLGRLNNFYKDSDKDKSEVGVGTVAIQKEDGTKDYVSKEEYERKRNTDKPYKAWVDAPTVKIDPKQNYLDAQIRRITKENPNISKDDALIQANEAYANLNVDSDTKILNQTLKKADNFLKAYNSKNKTDAKSIFEMDYSKLNKEDRRVLKQLGRDLLGVDKTLNKESRTKALATVEQFSSGIASFSENIEKLNDMVTKGKDQNLIKTFIRENLSVYLGLDTEEIAKMNIDKSTVGVWNKMRHELYGSVLTRGENNNFLSEASSIYQTNTAMVVGMKNTMKKMMGELRQAKAIMGDRTFYMMYGNNIEDLQETIDNIDAMTDSSKTARRTIDGDEYTVKYINGDTHILNPKTNTWHLFKKKKEL